MKTLKIALIVVDMLKDFIEGSLKIPNVEETVKNIKEAISTARTFKVPIIYVCDRHIPKVDRELEIWGPHAIADTEGAKVIEELSPQKGDFTVFKRRYSGFFQTDLDLLLRELKVDTLALTGVSTDICVKCTAIDAFYRGYNLIIIKDCVAAFTRDCLLYTSPSPRDRG